MTRRRRVDGSCDGGFVLVVVLAWLGLLASLALGVSLVTMYEPMTGAAAHERVRLRRAAESAVTPGALRPGPAPRLERAPRPAGRRRRSPTAGLGSEPRTSRSILPQRRPGGPVGAPTPCDDGGDRRPPPKDARGASRNPRWRLFVHVLCPRSTARRWPDCPCYLVAWIADDPADDDGDPASDARPRHPPGTAWCGCGAPPSPRAAPSPRSRRSWRSRAASRGCSVPGIRVQSWGTVGEGVP